MSTVRLVRFAAFLLGACVLSGSTGCGSPVKTDVSGTVKLNGRPPKYTGIQVVFQHPDGTLVTAPVAEDGTYKAEGVPSGEVKVCFAYITPEAAQQGAEAKAGGTRLKKPGGEKDAPKPKAPGTPGPSISPIPEPLRDVSTSNLTFKVEAGKANTFDYDIK
jgi:hypothetical protein